ncbi:MAG: 4Fe-4S binding protein [Thermoproteota archaeon]
MVFTRFAEIDEPFSYDCRGCHVCTLACPKGAISV